MPKAKVSVPVLEEEIELYYSSLGAAEREEDAAWADLSSLAGALHELAKERPVTVEEMNEAIRRRAATKSERTKAAG